MGENETFNELRNSIELVRQEGMQCPEKASEAVRWMREGLAIYLEELGDVPEVVHLDNNLQFRTSNVSIETKRRELVQDPSGFQGWGTLKQKTVVIPVENTPAMEKIWLRNVGVILSEFS